LPPGDGGLPPGDGGLPPGDGGLPHGDGGLPPGDGGLPFGSLPPNIPPPPLDLPGLIFLVAISFLFLP
jgi:hypothetical protein